MKFVFIGVGVLISIKFGFWVIFGPQAFTYFSYVQEAQQTKDEIVGSAVCGDVSFDVLHTDKAYRGKMSTIDYEGYPPGIRQEYYLQGSVNGRQIFSELNDFTYPETYSVDRLPIVERISKGIVVDRSLFEKLNDASAHGAGLGHDGRLLVFPKDAISDNDLHSVATCFSKHTDELNKASRWPVALFVKLKDNSRFENFAVYNEFQCVGDHKITLSGNLARLDGKTYNIIGSLTLEGYLRAWTGKGKSYREMGMSQPIGDKADISPWTNCKNLSGETFGDYVFKTRQKIEFY